MIIEKQQEAKPIFTPTQEQLDIVAKAVSGDNLRIQAFAGMKMGMSVKEAIELAAKCDPYTNCNITIEEI